MIGSDRKHECSKTTKVFASFSEAHVLLNNIPRARDRQDFAEVFGDQDGCTKTVARRHLRAALTMTFKHKLI